ncbi:CapA family protein [bacterium]|nr:CapA family protein [bacterium]
MRAWFIPALIFSLVIIYSDSVIAVDKTQNETTDLIFVGDIFLGNWAVEFLEKEGFDYPFNGCRDIFTTVDLTVGNLENPITTSGEPIVEKQFFLKAPPGIEMGLFNANIRAVNLANNHILDYGFEGLNNTRNYLDKAGVKYFGAGDNLREALQPATLSIKGKTFAFLGFSATFPEEFWATDTSAGTAFPMEEDVISAVSNCAKDYDVLIVSFHWGAEKMDSTKDYQIDLAHLCIDNGADLVIGHHPHVVQGIEIYKFVPIYYSLGNFAFASYSESAKIGMLAKVSFKDNQVATAEALPLNVYNEEVNFQPIPLHQSQRPEFYKYMNKLSARLNDGREVVSEEGMLLLNP